MSRSQVHLQETKMNSRGLRAMDIMLIWFKAAMITHVPLWTKRSVVNGSREYNPQH